MIPMLMATTAAMGALSLLSSLVDSSGGLQHRIARAWGRMLMAIFLVRVRVRGAATLQVGRACVFASNHFSLIDTPLMFGFLPVPFRVLARAGLWRIPFIGWHLNRAGHLPVDRQNPRRAARNVAQAARKVQSGRSILVFPEGGRRRSEQARRFKTGAAHIALRSGAALVPVAIAGTRAVLPPGSWHLRPGAVELRIGSPIETAPGEAPSAIELTRRLTSEVARLAALPAHAGTE